MQNSSIKARVKHCHKTRILFKLRNGRKSGINSGSGKSACKSNPHNSKITTQQSPVSTGCLNRAQTAGVLQQRAVHAATYPSLRYWPMQLGLVPVRFSATAAGKSNRWSARASAVNWSTCPAAYNRQEYQPSVFDPRSAHTLPLSAPIAESTRGGGVTFLDSDSAPVLKFFNPDTGPEISRIWESDSCSDSGCCRSKRNLPCFYSRSDYADSCYCRNWKLTPDPVFLKFLTQSPDPGKKRRILPESNPALRIHGHLWKVRTNGQRISFVSPWMDRSC